MNKARRKEIQDIIDNINETKEALETHRLEEGAEAIDIVSSRQAVQEHRSVAGLAEDVENIQSDEQEYFDNMPETFQNGEKGERAQQAADSLGSAREDIDNAASALDIPDDADLEAINAAIDEAVENLDNAIANLEQAGE